MNGSDATAMHRLLDAVMAVGSGLDLEAMLQRIAVAATQLVGARYGALGVLDEARQSLSEFVTIGVDADVHADIGHLPTGHGILGTLIRDPTPLRLPDLTRHPDSLGFPPGHPPMRSFLGVPILVAGEPFGNLYLCDKAVGDPFTDDDEELVVALAAAAGVAIDNARLHNRVAELALFEDRDRIARDLHDTVIQRVFAVGLTLQGTIRLVSDPVVANRLDSAVDELDETVRDLRAAIFDLQTPGPPGGSVHRAVVDLVADASRALGFAPSLDISGPVDEVVDGVLASNLLATLREMLTNVARHARAPSATVTVRADDHNLVVEVADDGAGFDPSSAGGGRGLANMASRARSLGGRFEARSGDGQGTVAVWTVPVRS